MIPLWATDFPHITQLKINQLVFFLPPKIPRRVNHVSTDFRNFIYSLTRHRKIFIKLLLSAKIQNRGNHLSSMH